MPTGNEVQKGERVGGVCKEKGKFARAGLGFRPHTLL